MKTAFIFPGQGSQKIGMLGQFEDNTIVQDTFAMASHAMHLDLWQIAHRGPDALINRTDITQPLLLTASIALWRLYKSQHGIDDVAYLAGHSLGEYSALVAAGSMDFLDAVDLVNKRGIYMQQAMDDSEQNGAMAAILGLERADVEAICVDAVQDAEILSAVNFNSPQQTVIAGHEVAVERACELTKTRGAKRALKLAVSVPSHCALMQPAAEQLGQALNEITLLAPQIPVIHNASVEASSSPAVIRDMLEKQLFSPVRWVETINVLSREGCEQFIECGPNKVLVGLGKRIDKEKQWISVEAVVTA